MNTIRSTLFDEHAVSIGIKAVALGDGVGVGAQDVFFSTEGADQHEQRGLRQVEICKHCLDHLEFETSFGIWINEEVGCGGAGRDGSSAGANRVFEGAHGGGAYGDDATLIVQGVIDGGGGAGGDGVRLGVEFCDLRRGRHGSAERFRDPRAG